MKRGGAIRFAFAVVGGWVMLRAAMLASWQHMPAAGADAPSTPAERVASFPFESATARKARATAGEGESHASPATAATPPRPWRMKIASVDPVMPVHSRSERQPPLGQAGCAAASRWTQDVPCGRGASAPRPAMPPSTQTSPVAASLHPTAPTARRWHGSAWLFARDGRADPLATGGQLGGGQGGARITYDLGGDSPTRFALAARVSRPLQSSGLEAAVGVDWHPLSDVPFRLSVERRVRLEQGARNAWSAYAAGGFYRELPHGILLDGYAQAGVVGARARDLFADGAVRAVRRLTSGPLPVSAGAGIWGAAQPGATRLDLGPHIGVALPIRTTTVSLALDARFRVAGRARPGSGLALTLAGDF